MKRIGTFFIAVFILSTGPARAELYQYTDSDGVVSFTDRIDTIPESSRATLKKIDESSLPQLLTLPDKTAPPEPSKEAVTAPAPRREWPVRTILVAALLTGLAWLAFRFGGGNILMKIAGRMMVTAALGAGVYLIFFTGGFHSDPSSTNDQSANPVFKRLSPIEQSRETAGAFQDRLADQQEALDRAAPEPEEPTSPFHPPIFRP